MYAEISEFWQIHSRNLHTHQVREHDHHLKKVFSLHFYSGSFHPLPEATNCSYSYPHSLVFPALELNKSGITKYVLFCVWLLLLNVIFLRLFCVVVLLQIHHHLFNRFPLEGHLSCFRFWSVTNKALLYKVFLFLWTQVLPYKILLYSFLSFRCLEEIVGYIKYIV